MCRNKLFNFLIIIMQYKLAIFTGDHQCAVHNTSFLVSAFKYLHILRYFDIISGFHPVRLSHCCCLCGCGFYLMTPSLFLHCTCAYYGHKCVSFFYTVQQQHDESICPSASPSASISIIIEMCLNGFYPATNFFLIATSTII